MNYSRHPCSPWDKASHTDCDVTLSDRETRTISTIVPALLLACLAAADMMLCFSATAVWAALMGGITWWLASGYLVYMGAHVLALHCHGKQRVFTLVMAAGFLWYLQTQISHPHHSHFEATQELACMLRLLAMHEWSGFNDLCHLGYPARQFMLPAVPTLLFGVQQWTLNAGHAGYLILGVVLFTHGAVTLFERTAVGALWALSMLLLAHVYYFLWLVTNFEQSMYPLSFALMAAGLAMTFTRECNTRMLIELGLVCYFALFSYTPSLSLVGLSLVFIVWYGVRPSADRSSRIRSAFVVVVLILGFYASAQRREDMRLGRATGHADEYWARLEEIPGLLAGWGQGAHLMSYYLAAFLLVVGLTAVVNLVQNMRRLSWSLRFRNLLLQPHPAIVLLIAALWGCCVVMMAVVSRGYADPPPQFAIHRATVVFPVLFAACLYQLSQWRWQGAQKLTMTLLFCIGAFYGAARYQFNWHMLRSDNAHFLMLTWIKNNGLPFGSRLPVQIHFSDALKEQFQSMHDQALYYMPSLEYDIFPGECLPDDGRNRRGITIWVTHKPLQKCTQNDNLIEPAATPPIDGKDLIIY
jgi:hypothetical protein